MGRRTRYLLNRLANAMEDGSERLVGWLRAKAERKHRPRPLRFENASERMMREVTEHAVRMMMPTLLDTILRDAPEGSLHMIVDEGAPFVPLKVRWNEDADA